MYKPYRIISETQSGIPGSSMRVLTGHLGLRRNPFYIEDGWDQGTPGTLTIPATDPGVNAPFWMGTGAEDSRSWLWWRRKWAAHRIRVSDAYGVPVGIMDLPPDTTLLQFDRGFDGLSQAFRAKVRALQAERYTILPNDNLPPSVVPATEWASDSCGMLSEIQYHLLETVIDGGLTWSLWTVDEVLGYVNQRLERFIVETGYLRVRGTIALTPGVSTYDLPQNLADLKRVSLAGSQLVPTTKWELDHGTPGWGSSTGTPTAYTQWPEDSLTISVTPVPTMGGTLNIQYVPLPRTVTSSCGPMDIPMIFQPYLKYGVMADMLSKEGEANDPVRASFCETRWSEGIDLCHAMMGMEK